MQRKDRTLRAQRANVALGTEGWIGWETKSRVRVGFQAGETACVKALKRRGHNTFCNSKSCLSFYFAFFLLTFSSSLFAGFILFSSFLVWLFPSDHFWNRNVPIFRSSVDICLNMLELLIIIFKKYDFLNKIFVVKNKEPRCLCLNLIPNFLFSSFFFVSHWFLEKSLYRLKIETVIRRNYINLQVLYLQ